MEIKILEGARKGLVAPTSPKMAPSPTPRMKESTSTPTPNPPSTYRPEGPVSPGELALILRRWPLPPPRFAPLAADYSEIPSLEDT